MAAIRGKNTAPEIAVRHALRTLGVGYRLHWKGLPGRPDIAMPGRHMVIFVHGCFWHRHDGCRFAYMPKSRTAFWLNKFAGNVERDRKAHHALITSGWQVLTVWECETADTNVLSNRLKAFIRGGA